MEAIELEKGMVIWVKEFNDWASIIEVYITLGDTAVTFDNGQTLFFDGRRRFKEYE